MITLNVVQYLCGTMKFIFVFAILIIFLALVASKDCSLEKKNLSKKIKQYQKKCLKKGFKSSLGCKSNDKKLNKKSQKKCVKLEKMLQECDYSCSKKSTDGGWSEFGDWSECSVECGGGRQARSRTCTNPAPANGGAKCQGKNAEARECNAQECPTPVDGGWSDYGEWSKCSAECNAGTQTRQRTCSNPAPALGGADCAGDERKESQSCYLQPCGEGWFETRLITDKNAILNLDLVYFNSCFLIIICLRCNCNSN